MGSTTKLLNICKLLNNLTLHTSVSNCGPSISTLKRSISTTTPRNDLMEFFDHKDNWGQREIKSGRSWTKDEMRLKSNSDLHKLWYVLLKEKNMLLTMEEECKDQTMLFPSPERIDKVEESMENLEEVIRERNRAYHELETGENGERPGKVTKNVFGLTYYYKMSEHPIPQYMNKKWQEKYKFYKYDTDVEAFLLKYREKLYLNKKKQERRNFNHVIGLMNRFPNMNMEAVKKQFPDVDLEKVKRSRKFGGHFVPK
ncbi:39S ribosomal protein L47, mitochondrial-like [Anthonomus grandis grandis]|uniref:39S ribosomal protein L47, mitochondrial-like n=1 Tax=Anthonomus grandis grandis TaxID=2921223 RepID=UPI0021655A05|nr:39S ribosomal protein L47, mitochondrial-like [Anthonomus grandis grandis]